MLFENKGVHGCSSSDYSREDISQPKTDNQQARTPEGIQVAEYAEKMRSSDVPPSFIFICMAAATHPNIIDGKALVLTQADGELLMASDPVKGTLWTGDTGTLMKDRRVAEVRIDGNQYFSCVNNTFVAIEGDDAFYRAILTAVRQCSSDTITHEEVKKLRLGLADIIEQKADELWRGWQNCYEAREKQPAQPEKDVWFDAQETSEKSVSLIEDCKRCLKHMLSNFGELKESELIFLSLLKVFPAFPLEIMMTAQHLYSAIKDRKNIDLAIATSLALTSEHLANGNIISSTAQYIRNCVYEYIDEEQLIDNNSNFSSGYFFTALTLLAIAGKHYWRNDNPMPQRSFLHIPIYLEKIFHRASLYWSQLGRMAQHAIPDCMMQIDEGNQTTRYRCVNFYNRKLNNRTAMECHEDSLTDLKNVCPTRLTTEEFQFMEKVGGVETNNPSTSIKNEVEDDEPIIISPASSAGSKPTAIEMVPLVGSIAVAAGAQIPAAMNRNPLIPGIGVAAAGVSIIGTAAGLGWGLYKYFTDSSKHLLRTPNPINFPPEPDSEPEFPLAEPVVKARLHPQLDSVLRGMLKQGMYSQAVQKDVITPLSGMIDDSLKGLSLSGDSKKQRRQQSLSQALTTLLPTLTMQESKMLYQLSEGREISDRFTASEGYIYVTVNRHKYQLRNTDDGTPYIIDDEGKLNFIRFNQNYKIWEYVDEGSNTGYSAENRENIKKYRIPVRPASNINIDNIRNLATVKTPEGKNIVGVFIAGDFIPAWGSIEDDVIYTDKEPQSRVIIRTEYGWEFDCASSPMNTYVHIMLTEQDKYISNPADERMGELDNFGTTTNYDSNTFVKKDYLYYPVIPSTEMIYSLWYDVNTVIELSSGIFKLKNNTEILRSLQTNVEASPLGAFRIETEALNYIKENAARTDLQTGLMLNNGLYRDSRTSEIMGFIINGITFKVKEYTDFHLYLEKKDNNKSKESILLMDVDTWIRVRDEKKQPQYKYYKSASYYTIEKDDISPSVISLKTEYNLYKILQTVIDNKETANLGYDIERLIKSDKFDLPVYWRDDENQIGYFLYKGNFFPALFIDATDPANPIRQHSLKIFSRGDFFNKAKPIATVTMEKKGNQIELKTQQAALSEILNISQEEADLLVKNRPWRSQPGMATIEEIVYEACTQTRRVALVPAPEVTAKGNRPPETAHQRQQAVSSLYPGNINRKQLGFIKLTADKAQLNDSEMKLQTIINDQLEFLKENIIKSLDNYLHYHHESFSIIHGYFNEALNIHGHEFTSDFLSVWRSCLNRIDECLNKDKIYLIYGKNEHLSEDEKAAGNVVYMSSYDNNIYINMDKVDADEPAQLRLVTDFIEIITRTEVITDNLFDISKVNGTYVPVKDALAEMFEALKQDKLSPEQLINVQGISIKYLNTIPTYRRNMESLLSPEILAYLVNNDPTFRAWLMRYSAPLMTLLSLDMFYLLATEQYSSPIADAWRKCYGELRGIFEPDISLTEATTILQSTSKPLPADPDAVHSKTAKHLHDPIPESNSGPDLDMERRRGDTYIPGPHDNVFLPEQSEETHNTETKTFIPGHGYVTTIIIRGLECLGDKDLTVSEELRTIGKALQNPFVEFSLAMQEIYHMDYKNGDCPSPEDAFWLADRADVADVSFTTLVMLVPRLWPVFFLQVVLGPFLQQLADDLEGRDVPLSERIFLYLNAFLQAIPIVRGMSRTFKGSERIRSFPVRPPRPLPGQRPAGIPFEIPAEKPGESSPDASLEDIFNKRFKSFKNNKELIEVNGELCSLLLIEDDQNLMIVDGKGRYRYVKYNQQTEHWDIVKYTQADKMSEVNQEIYKLPEERFGYEYTISLGEDDIFTLKIPGKDDMTGVFIGSDFIPAQREKIGKEIIAYTTLDTIFHGKQKLLIKNQYGWEFEAKSSNIDDNLAALLESGKIKAFHLDNARVSAMDENGICHEDAGYIYIKSNYQYYTIELVSGQQYRLTDHVDNAEPLIQLQNGYFELLRSDDIVFTFENTKIEDGKFLIDTATLRYLHEKAETSTLDLPHSLGNGVYEDSSGRVFGLLADNTKFVVDRVSTKKIEIKYKADLKKDNNIKLWSSDKVWYRRREGSETTPLEYITCRVPRMPLPGIFCMRSDVTPEKNLHRLLKRSGGDVTPPGDLEVTDQFTIPYLYQSKSTKEYYFKYRNKYFAADIIAEDSEENPTGYPCVKVYSGSDFYSQKAVLTTIVSVHDESPKKLVDMTSFIANNMGGDKKSAMAHIKRAPYIGMENSAILDSLTTKTRISDTLYVEMPDELPAIHTPAEKLSYDDLQSAAIQSLIPESVRSNNDYSVIVYDLNPPPKGRDPYVFEALVLIDSTVNHVEHTLFPSVLHSLSPDDYNNPLVGDYLQEILGSDSPQFMVDAETSLISRIDNAYNGLRKRKIKLVYVFNKSQNEHARYTSTNDRLVFIHPNDDQHLFINMHLLDISDNAKYADTPDLSSEILYELMKSTGTTSHYVDIPKENEIYINIKDAFSHFQNTMKAKTLPSDYSSRLETIISRYIQKSPVYNAHPELFSDISKNGQKFNYMFENDPAFKLHCMVNSDDFISLLTQDIYYWGEANRLGTSDINSWLKRYGMQRGVIVSKAQINRSSDSFVSSDMEVHELPKFNPSWTGNLYAIEGKKNVYAIAEDKFAFSFNRDFYEMEFTGKSGRIVSLGQDSHTRQLYYYNPETGDITPILSLSNSYRLIEYNKDLDLYQMNTPGSDQSEVYRYDNGMNQLVLTGADRIVPMPGGIIRIEFPDFNIYHLNMASHELFLQGYGQLLDSTDTVPSGVRTVFYSRKGNGLNLYRNSINDLLDGRFQRTETRIAGEVIDDYDVYAFDSMSQSYYHLARKNQKNLIQITSSSVPLETLLKGVSNTYPGTEMKVHLLMGRSKENVMLPKEVIGPDGDMTRSGQAPSTSRQHMKGETIPPGGITKFVPLPRFTNFLSRQTSVIFEKAILDSKFMDVDYAAYRGTSSKTATGEDVPPYIVEARKLVFNSLSQASSKLEQASMKLSNPDYEKVIDEYISYSLDTTDQQLIDQAKERLQEVATRVNILVRESRARGYDNVVIVSSKFVKDSNNPNEFKSTMNLGANQEVAFVIQGDSRNSIYVMNDALWDMLHNQQEDYAGEFKRLQIDTIIHENSHLAVYSIDAAYILDGSPSTKDSKYSYTKVKRLVETEGIEQNHIVTRFMSRLYKFLGIDSLDWRMLNQMVKDNPMLLANIVLENADTLSWYLLDIADLETTATFPRGKREAGNDDSFAYVIFRLFTAASLTNFL